METCIIEDHRSIKGKYKKYSFINDSILYFTLTYQEILHKNPCFGTCPSKSAIALGALTPARIKRFMAKAATWGYGQG